MRRASSREHLNILNHTLTYRSPQRDHPNHFYKKNSTPIVERTGNSSNLKSLLSPLLDHKTQHSSYLSISQRSPQKDVSFNSRTMRAASPESNHYESNFQKNNIFTKKDSCSWKENQKPYENISRIKINPPPSSILKSRNHSPNRLKQRENSPILDFYKTKTRKGSLGGKINFNTRGSPVKQLNTTADYTRGCTLSKRDRVIEKIFQKKSMLLSNKSSLFQDIYRILEENIEKSKFLVDLFVQIQEYERQVEQGMIIFMQKMDPECSVSEIDNCLISTLNDLSTLLAQRNEDKKKQSLNLVIELEDNLQEALNEKHYLSEELAKVHYKLESRNFKYQELKKELLEITEDFKEIVEERDQIIKRGIKELEQIPEEAGSFVIKLNHIEEEEEEIKLEIENFHFVEIESRSSQKIERLTTRLQHSNSRADVLEERNKILFQENKEAKNNFENLQKKCKKVLFDLNKKEIEFRALKAQQSDVKNYNEMKNQLHYALEECEALKFEIKNLQENSEKIKPLEKENKELKVKINHLILTAKVKEEKEERQAPTIMRESAVITSIYIPPKEEKFVLKTPKKEPTLSINEELLSNQLNQISDLVNKLECTLKKDKKVEFRELTFEEILIKLQDFEKKYQILIQESSSIIREQEEKRLILNEENDRLGIICRERLQQLQDQMYDRGKVLIKLAVAYSEVDRLSTYKIQQTKNCSCDSSKTENNLIEETSSQVSITGNGQAADQSSSN